ncbi:hypothetical protein Hypma_014632 [Hypsizygus marmoreus]|uniref:Uncharacterized protein n=1 Tax=Hypsizygus marmoreus TaxID=39966 RepID=A0A369JGU9_HYPMA|nr:hypothetical protein Hypma_014632 [Hypsizygus marmoreus]
MTEDILTQCMECQPFVCEWVLLLHVSVHWMMRLRFGCDGADVDKTQQGDARDRFNHTLHLPTDPDRRFSYIVRARLKGVPVEDEECERETHISSQHPTRQHHAHAHRWKCSAVLRHFYGETSARNVTRWQTD